jgi:putative ABC transport system substrate-binding protein
MRRREFIGVLSSAIAAWPRLSVAEVSTKRPLIGFLAGQTSAAGARYSSLLVQRMQDLGYVEGRNIDIVYFHADGDMGRLPALAAELVRAGPDVVVATNNQAVIAMKQATNVIPIVGTVLSDPTALGLVASLAQPGGNVTGMMLGVDTLAGKQFALAAEILRGKPKMGLLLNAGSRSQAGERKSVEDSAAALAITLVPFDVRQSSDLDAAFHSMAREQVDGIIVLGDPMFFFERDRIATLAIAARLPTVFALREHVEAGGLISYGVDQRANFRRAADLVDKILKGAKPGEIPVELPTKFELVINLKTARAIGVAIPESFLVRADEVIE